MLHSIRNSRILNYSLKALLFIALAWVLYRQVFGSEHWVVVKKNFNDNVRNSEMGLIWIVVLLMIVNWATETLKWKMLVGKLRKISWLKAAKGILFGITFSLFTPNRIGEFGGRVMAFRANRLPAVVATLIGSFSQIVMNLSLGATGIMLYLFYFSDIDFFLKAVFIFFYLLLLAAISFAYYNLELVSTVLKKYSLFSKIHEYLEIVKLYPPNMLLRLQLLSGFRYFIYCLQYLLLIHFFGVEISFYKGMILVSSIFFVQTILPSLAILDVAFRSSIAIFFLENFTQSELGVGMATFSLWLINLIIPGIVGAVAALQFKFFKEE